MGAEAMERRTGGGGSGRALRLLLLWACALVAYPDAAGADEECPIVPPHGHRIEVGWAKGNNQAEAIEQARQTARQTMSDKLCGDFGQARCNGINRHINPWGDGHWSKRDKAACAVVSIPEDKIDEYDRDAATLDAALADLATQLGDEKVTVLYQDGVFWASGCSAAVVGSYLRTSLQNHLSQVGSFKLAVGPVAPPDAAQLRLQLARGPSGIVVNGLLRPPKEDHWTPLTGPTFAGDLFGIEAHEGEQCRSDQALGLQNSSRAGAQGLQVEIQIAGNVGSFCEGEEIQPVVRVTQPARVQVYNVQSNGEAHLVWPPPHGKGSDGFVDDIFQLGVSTLIHSETAGDERLVAVAVPRGSSFGPRNDWQGYCQVPGSFGPAYYPLDAAVGSATFTVYAPGTGNCPDMPVREFQQTLYRAPICGE